MKPKENETMYRQNSFVVVSSTIIFRKYVIVFKLKFNVVQLVTTVVALFSR